MKWVPGFVALSAIWGSSFALIKVGVDAGVGPVWVAFWRCFFGAAALLAVCAVTRTGLPRDLKAWGHAAVVAALLNAVPFVLLAYGETRVSSIVAGVFNATTPLATLAFALALVPGERPTAPRLLGLAAGFAGVLVMLGVWRLPEGGELAGNLACVGSTICYGAGFAYTRRFFSGRSESAAALSALQIGCATLELAVVLPFAGAPHWPGPYAAAALVALGALGTGLAYILNLGVIRAAGPTVASTVTYVTPLWSTVIGSALLAEPLGWRTVAGGLLVAGGVVLTRRRAPVTAGTTPRSDRAPSRSPTRPPAR
ncbi:drug/metabolite transporter (DMT)-like permease [Thermocatellispora tengchongensis]|uniref:Drug/metabolite transporter (DMT)-like permease n=1 Tax=Thermocatellispora tengchongensis TaxID=1073253 RepID=A0A840NUE3_9ACTN|nr:DMT family transporter [Thermocatellispora tengchongensis]MBB5130872.1 drug/metabolite transporter (DMT)-like permease [Thermocatellispora tengchongensis]